MIELIEFIQSAKVKEEEVLLEKFLIKSSEIVQKLHSTDIDVLGISNNPSEIKHIYSDGGLETVNQYIVVGTGEPVGRYFLKRYWDENLTMAQVAELGYPSIRMIEKYHSEETIGLSKDNQSLNNKPQVWFIPRDKKDYVASTEVMAELGNRVNKRMEQMDSLDKND